MRSLLFDGVRSVRGETRLEWNPGSYRRDHTMRYCIGGHAKVLSDYKKAEPSTIQKNSQSPLNKFHQKHIHPALLIMSQTCILNIGSFCPILIRLLGFRECYTKKPTRLRIRFILQYLTARGVTFRTCQTYLLNTVTSPYWQIKPQES